MNMDSSWQDRLLCGIAGVVVGVVTTYTNHGSRLDSIERSLLEIRSDLQGFLRPAGGLKNVENR